MDFFDKHKALIITCLIYSIVLLALYNFSLSSNNKKARELLVDLENFQAEEPVEQEPEKEEIPQETNRQTAQTHQAFNENTEAREENFKSQLDEIFEKNSASQLESTEDESSGTSGSYNFQEQKKEVVKRSDGNQTTRATSTKSGGMDHSSISFSLLGRSAREIPNPVYTCDTPGKIVVNISVNAQGRVISTSINKSSSSTTNECLTEQALKYAAQAVFSSLPGRNSQPGTITYQFKP
ncbi:TonB family protein [Gillisia sp. Q332]|uniref:TonB family protein n=1 Tax=Gillisia xinjiangensis TaxID=3384765 RepID=UPI00391C9AE0